MSSNLTGMAVQAKHRHAKYDLELIEGLADNAGPKGLDPDHLDQMYSELADYSAVLGVVELILAGKKDPRSHPQMKALKGRDGKNPFSPLVKTRLVLFFGAKA